MAKKNWIKKAVKNPGALREKASKAGAIHDGKIDKGWLQSKSKGNDATGKQARLAIALGQMRH